MGVLHHTCEKKIDFEFSRLQRHRCASLKPQTYVCIVFVVCNFSFTLISEIYYTIVF
jgi:hypothetical protein